MENKFSIDPLLECYIEIINNLTILTNDIIRLNNDVNNGSEKIKSKM